MTVDCPLTCYVCGRTRNEWMTVDLIGCLKKQEEADKKFEEKFGRCADSFLFVCHECRAKNRVHAKRVEEKYGVID